MAQNSSTPLVLTAARPARSLVLSALLCLALSGLGFASAASATHPHSSAPDQHAEPDDGHSADHQEPTIVTIWSYRQEPVIGPVLSAFTEATGIPTRFEVFRGDAMLDALPAAKGDDRPDLILTVDALRFETLKAAGQLAALPSSALAAVPEGFHDVDGHWAGISWRVRGLVQRREDARDRNWAELPRLAQRGRLCVRPGRHIYNRSHLAWQIPRVGETEALARAAVIHGQRIDVDGGDRDQIMAVAEGRCDVAIVNHYYLAHLRLAEDEALRETADGLIFGNPDLPLAVQANISGIAMVADSRNPIGAEALALWLLDPGNQPLYADLVAEFPISWPAHDVPLGAATAAFEVVYPDEPWPAQLAPGMGAAEQLFLPAPSGD